MSTSSQWTEILHRYDVTQSDLIELPFIRALEFDVVEKSNIKVRDTHLIKLAKPGLT